MIKTAKIRNGYVRGSAAADPRIISFKGIPYAQSPTGENRWRAPRPCEDWNETCHKIAILLYFFE